MIEQTQGSGGTSEGKVARGWRLTKVAWDLIRRDPTMIAIALIGAGFGLAGAAATFYFSGWFSSPTHSNGSLALAGLIALYPMTFISVFFNVALAGAATASLDGRPIGVREALDISWKRSAYPGRRAACVVAPRRGLEPGDHLCRAPACVGGHWAAGDRQGFGPPDQGEVG